MGAEVLGKEKRMAFLKPKKKIRRFTSKREALKRIYAIRRRDFLIEHPWCAWGLKQNPPVRIRSEEIHHTRGRIGRLLTEEKYWLAVSAAGHDWIHNNMDAARRLGLLCQKGQWNLMPKK